MRTSFEKNIIIEVGLIEQADQVNIQDPPFSTERVQVGKIAQPILQSKLFSTISNYNDILYITIYTP